MILGVIFFIILLLLAYLFIFDPFNIKPFIFNNNEVPVKTIDTRVTDSATTSASNTEETNTVTVDETKSSGLSPAQESALKTIGIEPESVPSNFTPEQLSCFEAVLGKERVVEIKRGDTPTVSEFYKAKECI